MMGEGEAVNGETIAQLATALDRQQDVTMQLSTALKDQQEATDKLRREIAALKKARYGTGPVPTPWGALTKAWILSIVAVIVGAGGLLSTWLFLDRDAFNNRLVAVESVKIDIATIAAHVGHLTKTVDRFTAAGPRFTADDMSEICRRLYPNEPKKLAACLAVPERRIHPKREKGD